MGGLVAVVALGAASCGGSRHATPLPLSVCSDVVYHGDGKPRYLIVSDLPLRQADYSQTTRAMSDAIRFVLSRRGFKAGKYTIGYQSCDDSTAQADQFTVERCVANAKAYAVDRDVLGVVGPFNSACGAVEIPILNRTTTGPLALISPSTTDSGLTHVASGTPSDVPAKYYPTGVRNFFRVATPDDAQLAAAATLFRRLGAKRPFVLNDQEYYGRAFAAAFRDLASRTGLAIAGSAAWDGRARRYSALVRRIRRSRADGVYIAGASFFGGARLVADLRDALGPWVPLVASDGFAHIPPQRTGSIDGLYVCTTQLDVSLLPPHGQEIVRRFGAGRQPGFGAPYAAQAAEVLLDAIARSDGTRRSVVRELFAARVRDGIIGSFGFDRNGDIVPSKVTILRVRSGRLRVDRVIVGSAETRAAR